MTAVVAWARLDLRRRWRSLAVLTLLVALSGGVILATAAGARRTSTALDRLRAHTAPADTMVLPNEVGFNWDAVRKFPSVESVATFSLAINAFSVAQVHGAPNSTMFFPAGDPNLFVNVERMALTRGRVWNPARPDEAMASDGFIEKYGDTLTISMPSPRQLHHLNQLVKAGKLDPNADFPASIHLKRSQTIHIVGEGKAVDGAGDPSYIFIPSYGFFQKYVGSLPDIRNAFIRLRGGEASIPAFTSQLAALAPGKAIDVVDLDEQENAGVGRATTFAAKGWLAFSAVALLASLVLIGQAFVRFCSSALPDLETLAALGFQRRQSSYAAAAGPLIAVVLGSVLSVGVAIALSPLFPTGLARTIEPDPGLRADPLVLGVGFLALLVIGSLGACLGTRAAYRRTTEPQAGASTIASAVRRIGLGVVPTLGTRFALEAGRGSSRVPVRPALVGAVAAVVGVVGALTFRTGLDQAAGDPARFGQTLPEVVTFGSGAPPPGAMAAARAAAKDPAIAVMDDMRINVFTINGRSVTAFGLNPIKGAVDVVTLDGAAPTSSGEIALGPRTAAATHLGVGDTAVIDGHDFEVSGIAFVPEDSHSDYTDGAWMTDAAMSSVQPDLSKDKYHRVRFAWAPGTNIAAATKRLGRFGQEFYDGALPAAQADLLSVRVQPLLLGGFLILLGIGALGNALATAVRRRRHDVAVMRSLGMTRRQARLTIATQASVLALVGLTFGIPLGIAAGRTTWRALAHATPVFYVPPLTIVGVLLVIPGAVVAANALAALPARRAARMRPADILRAE